jgi:UDP-N-acetylglucosamine acyltransferase
MIHPTAVIDASAEIDGDAEIGPYAVIEGPVRISKGCRVMAHAWIGGDTLLGEGCVVFPSCAVGGAPQDFSYDPARVRSSLIIGNGCVFREFVTIHRSAVDGCKTEIGSGVYLMNYTHIAHDCRIEDGVTIANSAQIGGHVTIGRNAVLSGNLAVHQHVRIGPCAMISATSFITQDIPPWCTAQGAPGRVVGLNTVGLRRNGFSQERRNIIKGLFRELYRSDIPFAEIKKNFASMDSADARVLSEFLNTSKRGIAARRRGADNKNYEA